MKLTIAAVGHRLPGWINDGVAEYLHRLPREYRVDLKEIRPAVRGDGRTALDCMAIERERIESALAGDALPIVLAEEGKTFDSQGFAGQLDRWRQQSLHPAFIIGGADGVAPELKKRAPLLLSLSPMTLPHGLARLVLAEQIYRAVSIIANHPYHRS